MTMKRRCTTPALLIFTLMLPCSPPLLADGPGLTLRDAALLAVRDNPLVKAAHRDVEIAESRLGQSWRQYSPDITLNARYSYLNDIIALRLDPITLPLPPKGLTLTLPPIELLERSTLRADVSATVPLFTGLRIEAGIRASRHLLRKATMEDTLALERNVAEALLAYHGCLLAHRNAGARSEALETVRKHRHDAEALQLQGVATQYDLIRASLAENEAIRSLDEARNLEALSLRSLKKTLNIPDSSAIELADTLSFDARKVDLDAALAEAAVARPELAMLDAGAEAARAAAWIEDGKMLPQIYAYGRYELVDRGLTPLDPKWAVGIGASLTLFNGLKDLGAAGEYELLAKKTEELRQDAAGGIALEVRRYYFDMQTAEKEITSTGSGVALAAEALRMAQRRFETGTGTSLEVIDAQTGLVANRTAAAAALYRYRVSYINLVRALGRTTELLTGVF
jgi:outer membrane protein